MAAIASNPAPPPSKKKELSEVDVTPSWKKDITVTRFDSQDQANPPYVLVKLHKKFLQQSAEALRRHPKHAKRDLQLYLTRMTRIVAEYTKLHPHLSVGKGLQLVFDDEFAEIGLKLYHAVERGHSHHYTALVKRKAKSTLEAQAQDWTSKIYEAILKKDFVTAMHFRADLKHLGEQVKQKEQSSEEAQYYQPFELEVINFCERLAETEVKAPVNALLDCDQAIALLDVCYLTNHDQLSRRHAASLLLNSIHPSTISEDSVKTKRSAQLLMYAFQEIRPLNRYSLPTVLMANKLQSILRKTARTPLSDALKFELNMFERRFKATQASTLHWDNITGTTATLIDAEQGLSSFDLHRRLYSNKVREVWELRNSSSGEMAAIKTISVDEDRREFFDAFNEVHFLKTLKHPGIIKLLGFGQSHNNVNRLAIITELCDDRTLNDYQYKVGQAQNNKLIDGFLNDITSAVRWLHSKHVVHKDLKPRNVLIRWAQDRSNNPNPRAVLADFGLSAQYDPTEKTFIRFTQTSPKKRPTVNGGTLGYCLRPSFECKTFEEAKQQDRYGLGVSVLCLSGYKPSSLKGRSKNSKTAHHQLRAFHSANVDKVIASEFGRRPVVLALIKFVKNPSLGFE